MHLARKKKNKGRMLEEKQTWGFRGLAVHSPNATGFFYPRYIIGDSQLVFKYACTDLCVYPAFLDG